MDKLKKLDKEICLIRKELENLIALHHLRDNRVIELSKKLDSLIVEYCKNRYGR